MTESEKDVLFHLEAKEKILQGLSRILDLTAYSFGPQGEHIQVISQEKSSYYSPKASKIVREIELHDKFEKIGMHFVKGLTDKIEKLVTEGTCVSIILLHDLLEQSLKQLPKVKDIKMLIQQLQMGKKIISQSFSEQKRQLNSEKELEQLMYQFFPQDQTLCLILKELFLEMGPDGHLLIDSSPNAEQFAKIEPGACLEYGIQLPLMFGSKGHVNLEFDQPFVLIIDSSLEHITPLLSTLQAFAAQNFPLLLLCRKIAPDVLASLTLNYLQGLLRICPLQLPKDPEAQDLLFEQISAATQAPIVNTLSSFDGSQAPLPFGKLKKLKADQEKSYLFFDEEALILAMQTSQQPTQPSLKEDSIYSFLYQQISTVYPEVLRQHSQLPQIDIHTPVRIIESMLKEGVLIGAGHSYIKAISSLEENQKKLGPAYGILTHFCEAPMKRLALNSGLNPDKVIEKIKTATSSKTYFNPSTTMIEEKAKYPYLDAFTVNQTVVNEVIDLACLILDTEALVC